MRMLVWFFALFLAVGADAQYIPGRYIVELADEPAAAASTGLRAGRATAAQIGSRRAQVRARQQAVRSGIQQAAATVVDSTDTLTNTIMVEATSDQAAAIAALPGVARVHPEREFKPLLDRAVAIHKVDQAWGRVGQGSAGAGVKIAIIDSGIDTAHAGFQDSSLPVPDGYPKANTETDLAYTNNKVIVARSYANYFSRRDPDQTPRDHVGHGTALAMCAAGVQHAAPRAVLSGMAPKAWLGNYKVFGTPGVNDTAPESAILKAMDDAAADGMDIITLSLGSDLAPTLEHDIEVKAIERAASMGILVVVAAGNAGPGPMTVGSPATAPSAIAVGASSNDRVFSTSVTLADGTSYLSVVSSGRAISSQSSGPLADVAAFDGQGLACGVLPAGSLTGRVALILRGDCNFENKLINAQAAGAVAAVVYTHDEEPEPISMYVGSATLPAQMVSYTDGLDIKRRLAEAGGSLNVTISFVSQAVRVDPHQLASFSSMGPNVDGSIKPEILAVGTNVYTATQSLDVNGDMYDASGYISVGGTSFSTPIVAGALALLKAARPGLTVRDYRSLIINSAAQLTPERNSDPQIAGAGVMDLNAAVGSTAALYPAALSFGIAGHGAQPSQNLTIANLGTEGDSYSVSVEPREGDTAAPAPAAASLDVNPSGTAQLGISLSADNLAPGSYTGFVVLRGAQSGTTLRVPYWYAVPTAAKTISIISAPSSARAGSLSSDTLLVRVLDASGVALTDTPPNVTVSGGGSLVEVALRNEIGAGVYSVNVRWSALPGENVVTIQEGDAKAEVTVRSR